MFRNQLVDVMVTEGLTINYQNIVYVGGVSELRGYSDLWGYRVGTWYQRADLDDIKTMLHLGGSSLEDFIEV